MYKRKIISFLFSIILFVPVWMGCTVIHTLPEGVPRFVDNGDGTITDNATKLMWEASTGNEGDICLYQVAENYCETLKRGGYDNWKVPSLRQLRSLLKQNRQPKIDLMFECKEGKYWSRNIGMYKGVIRTRIALSFKDGKTKYFIGAGYDYYVRAVRKVK